MAGRASAEELISPPDFRFSAHGNVIKFKFSPAEPRRDFFVLSDKFPVASLRVRLIATGG